MTKSAKSKDTPNDNVDTAVLAQQVADLTNALQHERADAMNLLIRR